jgi:hypothetical protein
MHKKDSVRRQQSELPAQQPPLLRWTRSAAAPNRLQRASWVILRWN